MRFRFTKKVSFGDILLTITVVIPRPESKNRDSRWRVTIQAGKKVVRAVNHIGFPFSQVKLAGLEIVLESLGETADIAAEVYIIERQVADELVKRDTRRA